MAKLSTFLKGTVIGSVLALSTASFITQASVLLSGWDGSNESGFGSLAMDPNDDGSSSEISFNNPDFNLAFENGVNFFGNTHESFFINNNGNITFGDSLGAFTSTTFPSTSLPMIAPFWADVDTRCDTCGEVFIGSPNAETIVVTWNEVGFFAQDSSLTNTFQLVLIDRADTGAGNFDVEFRYEDINWTTGDASDGDNGLGGTPAQAGYDSGDGINFYIVPGSQTSEVVNLDTANSNSGTAGIWTFAIRDGELPGDTADNPILPIINPQTPTEYSFEFVITDPTTPIFIDPDVAIGYDYIVNSGPNVASVILPTGFDDNLFDLWLWDANILDWFDTGTDIIGGVQHFFAAGGVDRFRILGIDTSEMVDPTNGNAFVTGLTYTSAGTVNMNQNAISVFIPDDVNLVSEPSVFAILCLSLVAFYRRKKV